MSRGRLRCAAPSGSWRRPALPGPAPAAPRKAPSSPAARACRVYGYVAPTRSPCASARAAAHGSSASVIARTTATRVAPARLYVGDVPGVNSADREERKLVCVLGRVAHELEADRRSARLGRRRVHGADADVVDGFARRRVDLLGSVGGEADQVVGRQEARAPAPRACPPGRGARRPLAPATPAPACR